MPNELKCYLCKKHELALTFTDEKLGVRYDSFTCKSCDLTQTLGNVPPISPDYISLIDSDLDETHVFLQTRHKLTSFKQALKIAKTFGLNNADGARVLDVGCGVGGFLDFVAEQNAQTFGFDASTSQVNYAKRRHKNVRVEMDPRQYAINVWGTEKPDIDLVTMWDVLEHIRNPIEFLGSIAPMLRRNGLLFVSVPNGKVNRLKLAANKLLRSQSTGLIPWEHVFYYSPRSLKTALEISGYRVLQVGGVATYKRHFTVKEAFRRAAHATLRNSPYAFQIYAIATLVD